MPVIKVESKEIKIKSDYGTLKMYPTIENLTVEPSSIEQVFNHPNSYGYDTVTVKAVEADELNITPTTQNQEYTGLYGTVNVSAVNSSIDNNIQAENIKQGINILGVEGTFKDQANEIVDKSLTTLNITTDTIGSYSLRDSTNLVTINAPNLTKVLGYACYNCTNLKNINTNADIVSVAANCFGNCRNLEDFDFEISNINTASFVNCEKITKIICASNVSQLATNSVFSGCSSLKTLVLRKTGSVVTLRNVNSFDNTPFRNGEGGIVYVPNDLISSYESATNWSSLESTTFKAIEGSIYE